MGQSRTPHLVWKGCAISPHTETHGVVTHSEHAGVHPSMQVESQAVLFSDPGSGKMTAQFGKRQDHEVVGLVDRKRNHGLCLGPVTGQPTKWF